MKFFLRRTLHFFALLCALTLLLVLTKETKSVMTLNPNTITSIGSDGVGYIAPLGLTPGFPYQLVSDKEQNNGSTLILRENGTPSVQSHSLHADIQNKGEGRYSHWGNDLYFSARDNTDPRTNGYTYTVEVEIQPIPWFLIGITTILVSGFLSVIAPLLTVVGKKLLPVVQLLMGVSPFVVIVWCLFPPNVSLEIPVTEIQPYDGYGYVWQIPANGIFTRIQADENQSPSASLAIVRENGNDLLRRHAEHYLIARNGGGRYSHWKDTLVFSTSDNSDPRINGRRYSLDTPIQPGTPLISIAFLILGYQVYLLSKRTKLFRFLVGISCIIFVIIALIATLCRFIPIRLDFPVDKAQIVQAQGDAKFPDITYYRGSILFFRSPFFELNLETRPFRKLVEVIVRGPETHTLKAHLGKEEEVPLTNPLEQFSLGFGEFKFALSQELGERAVFMRAPMAVTKGGVWLLWMGALLLAWSWKRIPTFGRTPRTTLVRLLLENCALVGGAVLFLNLAGEILPIGQEDLSNLEKKSNFGERDRTLNWEQTKREMERLRSIPDQDELILAAARLVSERIIHNWFYVNTEELRLQVPVTENWVLWLRGELLPNYRQYNFADYRTTLERGVGNCGQASMALIGLLSTLSVESKIWGFDGHTVVWAKSKAGNEYLLDPDYGVYWRGTFEEFKKEPGLTERYTTAFDRMGTSSEKRIVEIRSVNKAFNSGPPSITTLEEFYGTDSFRFEKWAYSMKWIVPIILLVPAFLRRRVKPEPT